MTILILPANMKTATASAQDNWPHDALIGLFTLFLNDRRSERLAIAGLDERGCLTAFAEARGNQTRVNGVINAVRQALAPSATASIIMAHSHVIGDAEPSRADILATQRIGRLARLAGVRLLDHLIFYDDTCVSMAERGYI
ncbi:MAG: JAB domain-containing protein [Pseudomonadota bacterium]